MTSSALPTKEEINPIPECLDGQSAVTDFLGKTLEDAEEMFRHNSGHCWETLNYLGPVAFRFYVPAAIKFLHDDLPNTDPPNFSWFAHVIDMWLDYQRDELKPVADSLSCLFEEYLVQYSRFDEYDAMGAWAAKYFRDNPIIPAEALTIFEQVHAEEPRLRARITKLQVRLSELRQDLQ